MSSSYIYRGELWFVDLNPTIGHEQAKTRPCLVISTDSFNQGASELVVVIPLTTKNKNIPWHVKIEPKDFNGLKAVSFVMCDQLRTVSINRFSGKALGHIDFDILQKVEQRIKILLNL